LRQCRTSAFDKRVGTTREAFEEGKRAPRNTLTLAYPTT